MTVLVRVFMEKTQPVALATHTAWVQLWFQPMAESDGSRER